MKIKFTEHFARMNRYNNLILLTQTVEEQLHVFQMQDIEVGEFAEEIDSFVKASQDLQDAVMKHAKQQTKNLPL